MNKIIIYLISAGALFTAGYKLYHHYSAPTEITLFTTHHIERRSIAQTIKATGVIDVEDDLIKVCSFVMGTIRKMYVDEGDYVKKGTLLVEVDDGIEDFDVRDTQATLEQAHQELHYQKRHYERQKALYDENFISQDEFEKIKKNYIQAQDEVTARQARYNKAKSLYDHKFLRAPADGLIIGKLANEGEMISIYSPVTIMYTIATDIKRMKAKLEIDESVIGDLKKGAPVVITFDTYPYKTFHGTITKISDSPINKNNSVVFLATVTIDNSKLLLRPGMTGYAEINVAEKKDVLAVPGYAFQINKEVLKEIAQKKNYHFKEAQQIYYEGEVSKTVWIFDNDAFIELSVTLGINDGAHFQVLSGLQGNEKIIIDVIEPDAMKQFFQKIFGKGL
ncbi:MAG TPA: efflux RND transporter periplasmic adaptor subunit [Candidatus Babeliales bacterium]|nr:efflux RND transporter periplasmic adaptor subunit [Candidatus Babeliales bacterium]